jgi:hypothetical protein
MWLSRYKNRTEQASQNSRKTLFRVWAFQSCSRWRVPEDPGMPWVALPRTRRDLDQRSLLNRDVRIACRRKSRCPKTPHDCYRSVLVSRDTSGSKPSGMTMQGLNLVCACAPMSLLVQVDVRFLLRRKGCHRGSRSSLCERGSRNRILAANAAAPSHRCFRGQAERWVRRPSQAAGCVGFPERWLLYRLREEGYSANWCCLGVVWSLI